MLVSHRKRFIYTKTGKTGGTSVEVYFEPYCMRDGEWALLELRPEYVSEAGIVGCRGGPAYRKGAKWWNHMPAATIKSYIGDEIWNAYFKFCVVRNPFDRAVSAYHFFAKEASKATVQAPIAQPPVAQDSPQALATLREAFESWLASGKMPMERDRYLIDGEFCMDDVIRYERLLEDIERICKRLDIPFEPEKLPKLKTGFRPKIPLKEYYSKKSIEIVSQLYEYELKRFGYSVPF